VRPEGLVGMTPKSVKKKLKTPAFAAAVSREDITTGAAELGVDFDEHLRTVIAALADRRDELMPTASPAADAGMPTAAPAADAGMPTASPQADPA
jgi:hypothetical protein